VILGRNSEENIMSIRARLLVGILVVAILVIGLESPSRAYSPTFRPSTTVPADPPPSGDLVVSRVVYAGTASTVTVGKTLLDPKSACAPAGCTNF
jgi:hypothetical protein